jgi:hypothetical protein
VNDYDILRDTLADLADDAGTADLYDRAVTASRRLGRRRLALATMVAVLVTVLLAVPYAVIAGHVRSAPAPTGPRPISSHLAADVAGAPYYVATLGDGHHAEVFDAVTGAVLGEIIAPDETVGQKTSPTTISLLAGSADDRTFVFGVVIDFAAPDPNPMWFFSVHLGADGRPGPEQPIDGPQPMRGNIPVDAAMRAQGYPGSWDQEVGSLSVNPDGTEMAYSVQRAYNVGLLSQGDVVVTTLATGRSRTWSSPTLAPGGVAWIGEHRLAYGCGHVCVLDTTRAAGDLPMNPVGRLATPTPPYGDLRFDLPLAAAPNGTSIYVSTSDAIAGTSGLVEYSLTTGRVLRVVIPLRDTGDLPWSVDWSSPTGDHLVVSCDWSALAGTIDNGAFHPFAPASAGPDNAFLAAW